MERKFTPTDIENLVSSGISFSIGDAIGKGFDVFKKEMGLFIGAGIVFGIISIVTSAILAYVPVAGNILNQAISYCLVGGMVIMANKVLKNQSVSFGDGFDGFKFFGQIIVAYLIMAIFLFIASIPGLAILFASFGTILMDIFLGNGDFSALSGIGFGAFFMAIPVILIPVIAIYTFYTLTFHFIVLNGMGAWEAMEASRKIVMKKFIKFFIANIVIGLLMVSGVILLGIGLLFTIPLGIISTFMIYHTVVSKIDSEEPDIAQHLVG